MKQLTREILCAYLPHDVLGRESPTSPDYRLTGLGPDGPVWTPAYDLHPFPKHSLTPRTDCKLVLYPMTHLVYERTENGETFRPASRLTSTLETAETVRLLTYGLSPDLVPHRLFRELLSFRFDVFGLIKAGLAIDINAVTK